MHSTTMIIERLFFHLMKEDDGIPKRLVQDLLIAWGLRNLLNIFIAFDNSYY